MPGFNPVAIDDKNIESDGSIVDAFCECLSTIGQNTTNYLKGHRGILKRLSSILPELSIFSLGSIETCHVVNNARSMKVDLTGSIAAVLPRDLKQCIDLLVVPFCQTFNASIRSKTLPEKLKDMTYAPIFNGEGGMSSPSSHRPIATTTLLARSFKRCMVQ